MDAFYLRNALRLEELNADALSVVEAVWLARHMGPAEEQSERVSERESGSGNVRRRDEPDHDVHRPVERGKLARQPATTEASNAPADAISGIATACDDDGRGTAGRRRMHIGALPALERRDAFRPALLPLLTYAPRFDEEFDEAATIEAYASNGSVTLQPVMRRRSRRWLKVSMLIEREGTNALWTQPLDELYRLMRLSGTVRQLRRWSLAFEDGEPVLRILDRQGNERSIAHLAARMNWWPNELLIVASDFTTPGWHRNIYPRLLRQWASEQPMLLLHTLPRRLWGRSWTATPEATTSAPGTACATELMHVIADAWYSTLSPGQPRVAIPVAGLDPESISAWVNTFVCAPLARAPAVLLEPDSTDEPIPPALEPDTSTAQYRVMVFEMASSRVARQLARYLSVVAPLSFPVMRWIQQAMLPKSDPSHLAEFVLGGLLVRRSADARTPPDEVVYDFHTDVRPLMQRGLPVDTALDVMQTVGAYIEANADKAIDLRTAVETLNAQQLAALPADARAFAEVSRAFLERMGLIAPHAQDRSNSESAEARSEATGGQSPSRPGSAEVSGSSFSSLETEESQPKVRHATYKGRVLDLRWSHTHPEMLAVLTDKHVEAWNVSETQQGDVLYPISANSLEQVPAPLLICWWIAPTSENGREIETARRLVTLIVQGLDLGGWRPVKIQQLRQPTELRSSPTVLLVFETHEMTERDTIELTIYRKLSERESTPFVDASVELNETAVERYNGQLRLNLASMINSSASPRVADELDYLVGKLRDYLRENIPTTEPLGRATAFNWTDDGWLAVAYRDERGVSMIRAVDVSETPRGEALSSRVISTVPHRSWITDLTLLPRSFARTQGTRAASIRESESAAWLDQLGEIHSNGAPLFQERQQSNLPRRFVKSQFGDSWGVTNDEMGFSLYRAGFNTTRAIARLRPRGRSSNDASDFVDQSILEAWISHDAVHAVTSEGTVYSAELGRIDTDISPTYEMQPHGTGNKALAAATNVSGRRLALVRPGGIVEIWDPVVDRILFQWSEPALKFDMEAPCHLALSPDGRRIATSFGNSIAVRELPEPCLDPHYWSRQLLWVDDRPNNNIDERAEFARRGLGFTLARSTDEALALLKLHSYAGIISDMGRREGAQEGYRLLDEVRRTDSSTPFFIYAGSNSDKHLKEAQSRGAQYSTGTPLVLIREVCNSVFARIPRELASGSSVDGPAA
ncbi:response regulator [Paraburkholderia caribensis]|uniref:Response regulator n=1 Tax=Paraburkholderia caribensis TaxID=75105 RepID=A0A9Q6WP77_9BURK|nr:response regulator [Paraburkholderia caribensis]MCO4882975.1 response regulator [Paraburkholderia caribensis]PTB30681.1 hypothetical protein C9I56_00205 [Paraburkholderia caribensis]QLB65584.1 hypothetical protein A9O66_24730 [Paraburkholderia caribensis]